MISERDRPRRRCVVTRLMVQTPRTKYIYQASYQSYLA